MSQLRVVIADDNESMRVQMRKILSADKRIAIVGEADDGLLACRLVEELSPDVVLLDLIMPGLDGPGVMEEVRKHAANRRLPAFIILSSVPNEMAEETALRCGAAYYIRKPFNGDLLLRRVCQIGEIRKEKELSGSGDPRFSEEIRSEEEKESMEEQISVFLTEIGIPVHVRGYFYLREAILLCIGNMDLVNSVTKLLYPEIARRYSTTISRVERAQRHAVDSAWSRDRKRFSRIFYGSSRFEDRAERPTNSEFIASIADRIRLKKNFSGEESGQ